MLDGIECKTPEARDLQERLSKTHNTSELAEIEGDALRLEQCYPDDPWLPAIVGTSLRRRLEWDSSSRHFLSAAQRFPAIPAFLYEAALTSIDAGDYNRAQGVLLALSAGGLDRLSMRQLRGFWRASPLAGLAEVAFEAFQLARVRGQIQHDKLIRLRHEMAVQSASSDLVRDVAVISLGENCFPWSALNRWGLRSRDGIFEQESPFNLAQTTTNDIAHLLVDGTSSLIDPDLLSTLYDQNGTVRPLNAKYHFDFNHERGSRFVENRFGVHVERYENRIKKFSSFLVERACVFVHYTERDGDLCALTSSLARASDHSDFRILILDAWAGKRNSLPTEEYCDYFRIEFPFENYQWFQPDHWDSTEGVRFEMSIRNVVVQSMKCVKFGRHADRIV